MIRLAVLLLLVLPGCDALIPTDEPPITIVIEQPQFGQPQEDGAPLRVRARVQGEDVLSSIGIHMYRYPQPGVTDTVFAISYPIPVGRTSHIVDTTFVMDVLEPRLGERFAVLLMARLNNQRATGTAVEINVVPADSTQGSAADL